MKWSECDYCQRWRFVRLFNSLRRQGILSWLVLHDHFGVASDSTLALSITLDHSLVQSVLAYCQWVVLERFLLEKCLVRNSRLLRGSHVRWCLIVFASALWASTKRATSLGWYSIFLVCRALSFAELLQILLIFTHFFLEFVGPLHALKKSLWWFEDLLLDNRGSLPTFHSFLLAAKICSLGPHASDMLKLFFKGHKHIILVHNFLLVEHLKLLLQLDVKVLLQVLFYDLTPAF